MMFIVVTFLLFLSFIVINDFIYINAIATTMY